MLFMLLLGLLAMWLTTLSGGVPYFSDSASYIEQARSFLAGKGFESRPYGIDTIVALQTPDKLFPPRISNCYFGRNGHIWRAGRGGCTVD